MNGPAARFTMGDQAAPFVGDDRVDSDDSAFEPERQFAVEPFIEPLASSASLRYRRTPSIDAPITIVEAWGQVIDAVSTSPPAVSDTAARFRRAGKWTPHAGGSDPNSPCRSPCSTEVVEVAQRQRDAPETDYVVVIPHRWSVRDDLSVPGSREPSS